MAATTPAYQVIERELRQMIAEAKPGDHLPSDAELCERFGVSRMTARQAVQRLAADGLLYRVSGSGTFVAQVPVHRRMNTLLSFTDEMRRRGLTASSVVLDARVRTGVGNEVLALRLPPRSAVVAIRRLRLADNVPMAVEQVRLPAVCAGVLTADLASTSLFTALERIGRVPTLAYGTLTAAAADADEADLLGVAVGAPLLVEQRTIHDQSEAPLEFTESRYVGGRYLFDVELLRQPPAG
ncbi:GntR family transcriptional regulator [Plantactinospora soyae]|uniref:GntR family transcriptional regulator n=1 Tax=Plantactinospora soyae TaxID=1544732 RepID=A0A927M9Z1_9ACTN|nr:GntR family transcriptional regulator [Plantactinospora soyae]MBE1489680.1 GntR family transcriptional regulator [Plantactinospora soyae]